MLLPDLRLSVFICGSKTQADLLLAHWLGLSKPEN